MDALKWEWDVKTMTLRCPKCREEFSFDDADTVIDFVERAKYCIVCGTRLEGIQTILSRRREDVNERTD